MSYSDLLEREGINSQYLVIMRPRRLLSSSGWTLVTGSIYSCNFTLGQITAVKDDGSALAEAASASVGSDEWFYDVDTETLYVDVGANPNTHQVIVTYEIYLGTFDAHWYRDPLDDSSRVVYYEPLIQRSPQVQVSTSEVLFGFIPTFSGQIATSNLTKLLQEHIYESSFNLADLLIYHQLDELDVDNIKLVLRGYCKEIQCDDNTVNFSILDATSFFDKQYRNPVGPSFFGTTDFPALNPQFMARPIRQVFGVVEGFIPVNIDYVADNEAVTDTDNKKYVCIADETNIGTVSTTVKASPSSTQTRTYLTSVAGFRVGDTFWNKTVTTKYSKITAVGADYIDHDSIAVANASGNVIERSFVGIVYVSRDSNVYELWYGRDYTEYLDGSLKVAGFELRQSLFPVDITDDEIFANDIVYCRIYGHKLSETIAAAPFGSNSATTGNTTNGIVLLYHFLKTCLGLMESEINTATFVAQEALITDEIGLAIPANTGEDFPTYKELILQLSQTLLLKFFLDFDNKWKISQTGPLSTTTKTIEDDEILKGSFSYNFSYQDIVSLVLLEFNAREVSELGMQTGNSASVVSSESTIAKYLHNIETQKTFRSLHFKEAEAQVLADRLKFALGDRRGTCKISSKNRFFDTELDHSITVSRARMPGFVYDEETNRDKDFAVVSTSKSLAEINLELDDQKGIEDNQGSW